MEKKLEDLGDLLEKARNCTVCARDLPHLPNPIFSAATFSKVLIIGQAPGLKAHESGIAFNDASGDRLRGWLSVSKPTFYNPKCISILPMGFCFPGYKNGADAPPRKECAPTWHDAFLLHLKPQITLYVGRYAQQYYLPEYKSLTAAVNATFASPDRRFVIPHPSGRNNRWLAKHPWFEAESLPLLQNHISNALEN